NFNGPASFDYTVSDGNGGTDIGNVSGSVTPVNDPPVADDETFTVAEDGSVIIPVLIGDTDLDGDTLSVTHIDGSPISVGSPVTIATGVVSLNADGTLTFAPNANYNGPASFDYTVSDGNGGTDIGNVSGSVTPVNDAPIADDETFTVAEDGSIVIPVLIGDTDIDGDSLTVTHIDGSPISIGSPVTTSTGIVSLNADGSLTFTPNANYNGPASFDYTVSDGNGGTDIGNVSGSVTPTMVSVVKSLFDSTDLSTIGTNVAIGEELCFALLVTISEGNSTDLILTDLLPDGLLYDGWTLITNAAASNGLLAADFNGSVPAPSVSGGTFDGEDVSFTFGAITNAMDGDVTNNSFVLLVHATVSDVPSNHDPLLGTPTLTNTASADVSNGQPAVSSNPFEVTVVEPDLSVTIANGVTSLTAGQVTTYTITISNDGDHLATGVAVNGALPVDRVTFVSSDDAANFSIDGSGSFVWTPAVASLAPSGTLTLLLTVQVNTMLASGVTDVTIPVSVTHNNPDPTLANNSAADTDTLDAAPDLRLTKTDFTNSISPGQGSVYTLNVGNFGTQAASNVVVTETVSLGTTFNPAFSDPAWTNVGGGVYEYSIISLPAGASFNINFSVLIDNPAVAGQSDIVNTATITDDGSNGPDLDPSNNSATDTNMLDALPMYDIGIDDLQAAAQPGESLTYFVNFNNYGLQDGTGVVVSVSFPTTLLTNVSAPDGGIVDLLAGTITWNVGALAANDPHTFTITADVVTTLPSGATDLTLLASITDDGANGPDPDLSDNTASDIDLLDAHPDYSITIDDGETDVRPGDPLTYTINVANNGDLDGHGVVVTVNFPTAVLENVVASNGGVVDAVAGTITWNLGDLSQGDSTTLTVTTQVRSVISVQTPTLTLSATVTDDGLGGPEPTPLNNLASDLDRVQVYAYDSFHDWKDLRVAWQMPQTQTVGRPLAPLPVDPVFSGLTEPGSTLVARIYDADGRLLGDRQVVADAGGNWLVTFPNIIIYEQPHRMEIIVTPAISNVAHENGFNLRRYFHPAIHAGLVMTESLTVAGVFRNRAYNIIEAQHAANTNPLGFQWFSHAYELNAASSNISQM
ncbi:MAG: Ig-like domain-containing protein, partial [Planctomycetaceae bacterium]